eukprot:TRINITY_DN11785_c0_g1_i1.p1 TRINITY_DN11785_c0_g1~~TRINITY_DN11785_c0_g1_i1.p1  ORF type:complete len:475 (+),score=66.64 TRINITY_DN11785_c0_g1_i1:101-1525(+)
MIPKPPLRTVITMILVLTLYMSVRDFLVQNLKNKSLETIEEESSKSDDQLHELKEVAVAEERYLEAERIRVILRRRRELRLKTNNTNWNRPIAVSKYLVQFSTRKSVVKIVTQPTFDHFLSVIQSHRAYNNETILAMTYEILTDPTQEPLLLTSSNFNHISPQQSLITVKLEDECLGHKNVELEGSVVLWGSNNILPSAESCCRQCREFEGTNDGLQCNAWVYCDDKKKCEKLGTYQQCWLKYQQDPENTPVRGSGPDNPWTSGKVSRQSGFNKLQQTSTTCQEVRFLPETTMPASYIQRTCGSPATNAYENISNDCLVNSGTFKAYTEYLKSRSASTMKCYKENHVSYDGVTVLWGIGNKKNTAEECALSCINYKPRPDVGVGSNLPCNEWVFCPKDSPVCFEPDAHTHTAGDCWLRFTEHPQSPEINMRGLLDAGFRKRHPTSPELTTWVSGVVLLPNTPITAGVWGPRALW